MASSKNGFTLIELLVSLSIFSLILGFLVVGYNSFSRNRRLDQAAQELKTYLRLVRTKAMAGEKPEGGCDPLNGYRVEWVSSSSFQYFPICNGSGLSASAAEMTLKTDGVDIESFPDFSFEALTGKLSSEVTINLNSGGVSKSLVISESGEISIIR